MGKNILLPWDGVERRSGKDRRQVADRRVSGERRFDYREAEPPARRSLKAWMRSFSNARLGVDRRKGVSRRILKDRRSQKLQSLITPEELAALLQE